MDQTSGTSPTDAQAQAQADSPPASPAGALPPQDAPESPGFQSRGRARRRARFLRKARELAYRDLGGLVFNLHRFAQRNDALVLAKLTTLTQIDAELRAIEGSLGERRALTVLREAGITACPRCAAIHSSEDHFCPNCGMAMGRHADLPIAGAAPVATPPAAATPTPTPATTPPPKQPPAAETARPSAATGRSPTPPSGPGTRTQKADAVDQDQPTEILSPPASGS